jgi:hypothetical protein
MPSPLVSQTLVGLGCFNGTGLTWDWVDLVPGLFGCRAGCVGCGEWLWLRLRFGLRERGGRRCRGGSGDWLRSRPWLRGRGRRFRGWKDDDLAGGGGFLAGGFVAWFAGGQGDGEEGEGDEELHGGWEDVFGPT